MLRCLTAGVLALTLLTSQGQATPGPQDMSPQEAYQTAFAGLESGHSALANAIADALLQRDPGDFRFLILKSRAARNIGLFDESTTAGRSAWRQAESDAQKFTAAMVTAQALSSAGKRTRAQLWLRRASDSAPNDSTRALAARDFRYVRARNTWSTELSFNIAPSNNVNNGSANETTQLYGLPLEFRLSGTAQALAGIKYAASAATRYRIDQGANFAHDMVFQFSHRTYTLDADSRASAPGVSGSDFAFTQAAIGYIYQNRPKNGLGPYALNATAGHTLYGGESYFSYLRLSGTQNFRLSDRANLSFSGSGERQFGVASPDADIVRADLRFARQVGALGRLGLSLGHSASSSVTDVSNYNEMRTGVDLTLTKPIFGTRVSFGLDWRQRDYPLSRYDPSGRNDEELSASIDLVFTEIVRYGFNPTLSINAAHTTSNIGLYDSESIGVSFGMRSAF